MFYANVISSRFHKPNLSIIFWLFIWKIHFLILQRWLSYLNFLRFSTIRIFFSWSLFGIFKDISLMILIQIYSIFLLDLIIFKSFNFQFHISQCKLYRYIPFYIFVFYLLILWTVACIFHIFKWIFYFLRYISLRLNFSLLYCFH